MSLKHDLRADGDKDITRKKVKDVIKNPFTGNRVTREPSSFPKLLLKLHPHWEGLWCFLLSTFPPYWLKKYLLPFMAWGLFLLRTLNMQLLALLLLSLLKMSQWSLDHITWASAILLLWYKASVTFWTLSLGHLEFRTLNPHLSTRLPEAWASPWQRGCAGCIRPRSCFAGHRGHWKHA